MSGVEIAAAVLLAGAVAAIWVCALAQLRFSGAFDRLHLVNLANLAGPVFVVAAIVVARPLSPVKPLLWLALSVAVGTILSHAMARALRIRAESGEDE